MRREQKFIGLLIVIIIALGFIPFEASKGVEAFGSLIFKTNGGGIYPDYGLYIASYLREIGIDIEVKVEEWTVFVGTLCLTSDFDMGFRTFDFSILDPDTTKHFSVESDKNYEGLSYDIPYVNQSQEMIYEALSMINQTERIEKYLEWQNMVLDKIVPVFPFFNQRKTIFLWPNTLGYDIRWGLTDSLPHMSFDSYHTGQLSTDEFNLAYPNWRYLNPLESVDSVTDLVLDLITEPIIQVNPYTQLPQTTGLIDHWEMINESFYSFHVRDNIYWNPSFDIQDRTGSSQPLNSSDVSSLMTGFQGEYSNGTNQKLTAKDVIFTLLTFGNPLVSKHSAEYSWIRNFELNQTDELSFNLLIDGNPITPELDYYAPFWSKLAIPCIPEFFLNSTDANVTETTGNIPMIGIYDGIDDTEEWDNFRRSGFGCGKYFMDYYVRNGITVFKSNPNWYSISGIDGSSQFLNITTVNIKVIPYDSEQKAMFESGDLDYFKPTTPFVLPFEPYFQTHSTVSDEVSCLFFNLRRPFVGGVDNFINSSHEGKEDYSVAVTVRKAICYAIDRNAINDIMNERWYTLQHGLINELFTHPYLDEIFDYEYNIDTAIEWLTGVRPVTPTPTPTETIILSSPTDNFTTISFGISFLYSILTTATVILLFKNRKIRKRI